MKTAIYIEDGRQQLVLTPENKFEQNILGLMEHSLGDQVYRGSFYDCKGGWIRHGTDSGRIFPGHQSVDDRSLIFLITPMADGVGDE